MADMSIDDAAKEEYDLVVCPGGMPGKSTEQTKDGSVVVCFVRDYSSFVPNFRSRTWVT